MNEISKRIKELNNQIIALQKEVWELEESEKSYHIAIFENDWHSNKVLRLGFCTIHEAEKMARESEIYSDYGFTITEITKEQNELWCRYERLAKASSALNWGYPENKFEPVYTQIQEMITEVKKELNTNCCILIER